ncbi:MAG: LON peptidase substrate-binding domain-containing protein [Pyrinomonadaceae bacterium]
MTEERKKVRGIDNLAIFPLPLVLMPFELLPLHIFEPRYREMLSDVQAEKSLFGISPLESSEVFSGKPKTGSIGCVAEIRDAQIMDDGRSNILTIGVIRYRLRGYLETDKPYLIADVEFFEDDPPETGLEETADEVFELFTQLAKTTYKISGHAGELPEIPRAEPEQMSFLVGAAFNLDSAMKSKMVEIRSTVQRLNVLKGFLSEAVSKAKETEQINRISRTNGHSTRKIDIDGN